MKRGDSLADLRFDEMASPAGARLRYARSGFADGEPILFLHGYTDSWFSFSPVLPLLPPEIYSLAPDQRGHGDSARPERGYAMTDFAADAVALLDALGVRRATVVGHSMGSLVAQHLAIQHPDRVERLVLVGSATTAMNDGVLELREAVESLPDPVPAKFAREFQVSTVHRRLPEPFLDAVVAESLKLPARVWREALAGLLAAQTGDDLHEIRVPTLLLWGDRDTVFARAEQERLREGIPEATLRIYPETGHALHWEQPERFAADLQDFVQST